MQTTVASEATEIKKALKAAFPGVKFTVRSKSFSMGSSIHVSWVDFPTETEKVVRKVISEFEHVGGDLMIVREVSFVGPENLERLQVVTGIYFVGTNGVKEWKEKF